MTNESFTCGILKYILHLFKNTEIYRYLYPWTGDKLWQQEETV